MGEEVQEPEPTRTKSEPPSVKAAKVWQDALTDIAAMVVLGGLLVAHAVPAGLEAYCFWAIIGIGGGAQLLQLLGKRGSVVLGVLGFVPTIAKAVITNRLM